jgi:hypothetical protein
LIEKWQFYLKNKDIMNLIRGNKEVQNCVYSFHDRWLEDLDWHIDSYYKFTVEKDNLLDYLCAHLAYWNPTFDFLNTNENSGSIWERIKSDKMLNSRVGVEDGFVPETQIAYFDGYTIYDQISSEKIRYDEEKKEFIVSIDEEHELILNEKEFEEIGGEIHSVEDQEDFDLPSFNYGGGNGYGYIFQSPSQFQSMNDYLNECIRSLNVIYKDSGLDLINFK